MDLEDQRNEELKLVQEGNEENEESDENEELKLVQDGADLDVLVKDDEGI